MPEVTLTVQNKVGLHARPAAQLVETARQFPCDIRIRHGDREANVKSILNVLTLGAGQGAVVTIRTEGERAEEALRTLQALIAANFGEEA